MIKCNKDSRQLPEVILSIWPILDKKIRIDIALLRQMIEKKEIQKIHWTDTSSHIANSLTKLGASGQLSLDSFETKSLRKYYKYHNKFHTIVVSFLIWLIRSHNWRLHLLVFLNWDSLRGMQLQEIKPQKD